MPTTTNITNKVYENLGKVEETLHSTAANEIAACVGLALTNKTTRVVTANVYITDASSNKANYVKDLKIGPKSSARVINGGEKLLLTNDNSVSVISDTNNSLDVVFSFVTITTI